MKYNNDIKRFEECSRCQDTTTNFYIKPIMMSNIYNDTDYYETEEYICFNCVHEHEEDQ